MRDFSRFTDNVCFVTGATGFLGTHVARTLLQAGARVTVLSRPLSETRREAFISCVSLGDPSLVERLRIVTGDFCDPEIVHDKKERLRCLRETAYVFHLGAMYHLALTEQSLFEVHNVEGTANMLRFVASMKGLQRFVYASCTAVSGQYCGTFAEHELDQGQAFDGVYGYSKFVAEKLVAAERQNLPMMICRLPWLVGDHRDGSAAKYDGIYDLMRWIIAAGRFFRHVPGVRLFDAAVNVVPDRFLSMLPVNIAANAILALAAHEQTKGKTLHVVDSYPMRISEFAQTVCSFFQLPYREMFVQAAFFKDIKGLPYAKFLFQALADYGEFPLALWDYLEPRVCYDNTHARELLSEVGFQIPSVREYLPVILAAFAQSSYGAGSR